MRLLFLAKRHYMRKDLIGDRYGRYYEIPKALATAGYDTTVIAADYYGGSGRIEDVVKDGVRWISVPWRALRLYGPAGWWRTLMHMVTTVQPQRIVGCGDALQIIAGSRLALRFGIPFVADLYDNIEAFSLTRIPGVHHLYKRALDQADAVSCLSEPLADVIRGSQRNRTPLSVIGFAVPENLFKPINKMTARACMRLPLEKKLIGVGGALDRGRDMQTVFEAVSALRAERPDVELVLAGSGDCLPLAKQCGVRYLGVLEYEQMPCFFSALDVGIVPYRDSEFGRYCFPQKFYEVAACGAPMVAADVGEMRRLLAGFPNCRYRPGDVGSLVRAIESQFDNPTALSLAIPTWSQRGTEFSQLLRSVANIER